MQLTQPAALYKAGRVMKMFASISVDMKKLLHQSAPPALLGISSSNLGD